ncbi:MAG: histidine kinase [Clostridiales bacterium]|jgi:serine/threonine-protein kinase RsbW|nr:histidine kinase [Clostridiales bacterium]
MSSDLITLSVPAKPEYVMITRLTSAAVATRIGFDVDQIEDIKMAVAEAIIMIINQLISPDKLLVIFSLEPKLISVKILGEGNWDSNDISTHDLGQAQLSKYILGSMMDKVEYQIDNGTIQAILMHKNLGV